MKDILRLGHQYGVSHLMIFSSTKKSLLLIFCYLVMIVKIIIWGWQRPQKDQP